MKTKLLLAASAVDEIMVAIDAMMDGANTSMNEHEQCIVISCSERKNEGYKGTNRQ